MAGLGDLITNLSVDNTGFKKGLSGATSSLMSFAGGIGGIVAPIAGMLAGVWGGSAAISGAKESLANQRKLATVLEATSGAAGITGQEMSGYASELQRVTNSEDDATVGAAALGASMNSVRGACGFTTEQISEYASELQSVTNYEDDATVGAAAMLASFTNVRGDVFKGAIEGAMNLDTVMGGGLETNVKLLGKALNDPTEGLAKLAKAGIVFTDSQKQAIEAMQQSGNLLGAQQALLGAVESKFGGAARNLADPWTQFQNVLGDVGEAIGSTMLPSINVLSESMSSMLGVVAGGGEWFKSMGIEAAVVLSHMGGLLTLGVTQWELFFVELGNDAAHFFTDVIPAYLTWFGDNWSKVLTDYVNLQWAIWSNWATNVKNLWQTVLDFFAGNEVEFNWTPLTEGFKSAIDKLPDVPKRLTTAFEAGLKRDIEAMSDHLGESMNTQRAELEKKFSPLAKVPVFNAPEADAGGDEKKPEKPKAPAKTDLKAAFAGSSEAASIILRGVGGGKTVEQKMDKLVTVAKEQLTATKANKPPEMFAVNFA